jgi:hypothetical protein
MSLHLTGFGTSFPLLHLIQVNSDIADLYRLFANLTGIKISCFLVMKFMYLFLNKSYCFNYVAAASEAQNSLSLTHFSTSLPLVCKFIDCKYFTHR